MVKIAIFALTRGYSTFQDYNLLIQRTCSLRLQIEPSTKHSFDFLLFHEGNINAEHQQRLQILSGISIKFIDIHAMFTSWNETNPYVSPVGPLGSFLVKASPSDIDTGIAWPTGYRNMCFFYAHLCIDILDTLGYELALRVDEDCTISGSLNLAWDELVNNKNSLIGTPAMFKESHAKTNKVLPKLLKLSGVSFWHKWSALYEHNSPMVYSNVNLYFIRNICASLHCRRFRNTIEASAIIYRFRVGDAPLLFWLSQLHENGLQLLNKINYKHHSHTYEVEDGKVIC